MKIKKIKKILLIVSLTTISVFIVALTIACMIDNRHTVIELNGDEVTYVEYGSEYEDAGARAYSDGYVFGCIADGLDVTSSGEVDANKLGEYKISYASKFMWMEGSAERTVEVIDTQKPVITLQGNTTADVSWFTGYEEEGFTASDNVDGDISAVVNRTAEADKIVYTVTDSSGNTASIERKLNYIVRRPVISLVGSVEQSVKASTSYDDPGFSAADELGNDLTDRISVENNVVPYQPGTYKIIYSVSNGQGDTVSQARNVTVIGNELPETVMPANKTIYLTFDDGPGPYTSQLLDVLSYYGVKATFFVTNLYGYSELIGREYREGHTVAVHTKSHDYYTIYASEDAYLSDFNNMQEIIHEQTGSYACLFRFPGGSSNTVSRFNEGVMSRLTVDMEALGYKYFDWNVDSDDAGRTRSTDGVFENVIAGVQGNTYSVVLQHDIKDYSVAAVEKIILWGLENGYTFAPLSITSPDAHHGVNN